MEGTSEYDVLGRHQSCSEERIEVLSNTIERYHSSRNTPSSLYPESCNRKSHIREGICVTSSSSKDFRNMVGWKNWVQKLLNNQMEKLCNNPKVANQDNQIQTQIMIERGNALFALKEEQEKHPVRRRSKHVLFVKKMWKHGRTWKLVVCRDASHAQGASQTRLSHDSTNFNMEDETNHDRTVKPVVCRDANHEQSMLNDVDIDFRIPGLSHSVVKQAENHRVHEFVKKIENHPHGHSLQRDLQQNKAYNPFSTMTKKISQDMGNVELFELFETDPKTQCKERLSYWSEGIVYCTCGHLLQESAANRGVIQKTLDFLSIPNYVIKKGRPHGHRNGKTPEKIEYHQAHNLKKRCIKKHFKFHDRFFKDLEFRVSQFEHDRDEEVCIKMDDLADKDFSHYMTESTYFR